jgi:hypothetical protein
VAASLLRVVALGEQVARGGFFRRLLMVSAALGVIAALGSCSGSGSNYSSGTPAGTCTITLTGTSTTRNLSHSRIETITVTK